MHTNPAFRNSETARAISTARERGFGVLTVAGPDGVLASHVPFALDMPRAGLHLTRSNPIARMLRDGPAEALLIVSGPDAYISPDWYGIDDQVPTWNYVAVHIRGRLSLLPDDRLRPHLEHISDIQEGRLSPKPVWKMDKMSDGVAERMMRMIVPAELAVEGIESTYKLNQNKDDPVRLAAADAVARQPEQNGMQALSALMRDPDAD